MRSSFKSNQNQDCIINLLLYYNTYKNEVHHVYHFADVPRPHPSTPCRIRAPVARRPRETKFAPTVNADVDEGVPSETTIKFE